MRKTRIVAFLLAVMLCLVCVSAAMAKARELSPDESDALEKKVCRLLQDEGYKTDFGKDLRSVSIYYLEDGYQMLLTTVRGEKFAAEITEKGVVTFIGKNGSRSGTPDEHPKPDKKTMKKIEKKVNSFLKKVNPSLRKKIGKLKVTYLLKKGKKTWVEVTDSKHRVFFDMQITPSVRIWSYSQLQK